jgi:ribosomal protein S18 acetylase RimI-like enzyme
MYYTVIYDKLSQNQKSNILNFIKENFPDVKSNFGLESKTIIIINYENDKILGCVCLLNNNSLIELLKKSYINLDNYNFNYNNGLFIYNFCVDPNYRNKKIGSKLIDNALDLCKKINVDYVHCHVENPISKNLFLKKGFIEDKNISMLKFI